MFNVAEHGFRFGGQGWLRAGPDASTCEQVEREGGPDVWVAAGALVIGHATCRSSSHLVGQGDPVKIDLLWTGLSYL